MVPLIVVRDGQPVEELVQRCAGGLGHVKRGGDVLGKQIRVGERGEIDPRHPLEAR